METVTKASSVAVLACVLMSCTPAATNGPAERATPESLQLHLIVTPTSVANGAVTTLRAAVRNPGDLPVVARFVAPACGLRIVIESSQGVAAVTIERSCPAAGIDSDFTFAPGDSLVLEEGVAHLPAGTYRARAVFEAANGRAPDVSPVAMTVR